MNNATVHAGKGFLINVASRDDRAARDITATQSFRERDNVRLEVPMLKPKHFAGATESGLHFIGNQKRSVLATKFLRAHEEIGLRCLAAFALHRLNHEPSDVARTELSI